MQLSLPISVLAIANIGFVILLPRIFFRKDGTKNLRWVLTAVPYLVAPVFLLLNTQGIALWQPLALGLEHERVILESAAVPCFVVSIALIAYTVGVHRVPLSLWHQDNDAPRSIVTHGPYAWVRHPFYTAFLICLSGCVVACPHPALMATLLYALVALMVTARREERRLRASEFGDQYRDYMSRVGRFLPGVGKVG